MGLYSTVESNSGMSVLLTERLCWSGEGDDLLAPSFYPRLT
jgi:hypothetical protein